MQLLFISLGSWLLGLISLLLSLSVAEGHWAVPGDLDSATIMGLLLATLLFSLAYAPSLSWLRSRLGGCRPALLFPLASAVVLNVPVFLIHFFAIGRTLAPLEALACISTFLLMGAVFGIGFVWNYHDTAL